MTNSWSRPSTGRTKATPAATLASTGVGVGVSGEGVPEAAIDLEADASGSLAATLAAGPARHAPRSSASARSGTLRRARDDPREEVGGSDIGLPIGCGAAV
jgi:hypothetical protein